MPVTIRDVAERAGTSTSAVSVVLRGSKKSTIRVSEDTRARILRAAEELGYTGNALARALATGRTGIVSVLIPYWATFVEQSPFTLQLMSGVMEEATREGLQLLLLTTAGDDWQRSDPSLLMDSRADGVLAVAPRPGSALIDRCRDEGYRCLAVSYQPEDEQTLVVNGDDFRGACIAVRHLVSLGHRRIAHLSGGNEAAWSMQRRSGYRHAVEEAGAVLDPSLVIDAGSTVEAGRAATERLLELPASHRPTALFAANDVCADGALRTLKASGLRVPEDMAVVGFDDTWYARHTDPPLTTVNMPLYSMGRLAVRMLAAEIRGEVIRQRQPSLRVHLHVRESCGGDPADHPVNPAAVIDELEW